MIWDYKSIKDSIYSVPVFNIQSQLLSGVQPIIIKIPQNSTIENINAICTTVGTTDCEISIEKISESNFETNTNWTSILSTNVTIPAGKYSNKSGTQYVIANNIINANDILRLNIIQNGTTIKGLTVEITLKH